MKKIVLSIVCLALVFAANAQDFNANVQTARSSYSAGNLENSRFAMQQMLLELDIISGKETLKILPETLGGLTAKVSDDAVNAGSGFAGAVIHREYQGGDKTAELEIISNSPLVSSINAILALPFMGAGSNGDRSIVKIDGYKALIQKDSEVKGAYTVQIPLSSTLITLRTENYTEDVTKLANSIPVSLIAQKLN